MKTKNISNEKTLGFTIAEANLKGAWLREIAAKSRERSQEYVDNYDAWIEKEKEKMAREIRMAEDYERLADLMIAAAEQEAATA